MMVIWHLELILVESDIDSYIEVPHKQRISGTFCSISPWGLGI